MKNSTRTRKKRRSKKIALITASDGFGKDGKVWLEKLASKYGMNDRRR